MSLLRGLGDLYDTGPVYIPVDERKGETGGTVRIEEEKEVKLGGV